MSSAATAAQDFKLALYNAIKTLLASDPDTPYVEVVYGAPGTYEPTDIVSFTGTRSQQSPANYGTNRSREEELEQDVEISVVRSGDSDDLGAAARAYKLLQMIETQVRVTDTTVSGTVRECFLLRHQSQGETDPSLLQQGRVIEITATFQARARITS